ncbi:hypothetical protein [Vagococcus salmoninarum]|uniref:hypothetical protein n=1 Tax=Vagococcus salmoninarum TaxID=2739 RepID=UPI0018827B8F|nr:hypothetical protein [Vagococcus salmoninarum]MBE9387878.1 hypothetical protein [Vagococcus salmoninarum]
MFKEKFGFIPKKTVEFDGRVLKIGNYELLIDEVFCVYFRPFNFSKNEWGTVYFSLDGSDYNVGKLINKNMFSFTSKQTNSVFKLLELIDTSVVIKENDLGLLPTHQKKVKKAISCPECKSINVDFMGNDRKGFSAGKAVAGTVLTGGVGALAGFAGKKGDDQWHCKDCGQTFTTKK